ncbi:MAG: LysR family transcriptional regulator [Maricaulaceae bacterium]|jgi:DNA-binding transcriptional LysR family regulator
MRGWSDLDVFHAIVEAGSLAAAARRLNVSHPTVCRRLDALEARLGGALVVRGASGASLTPLGEAIADNVRRMAEEAATVSRLAVGGDQSLAGVVTVSAFEGVGDRALPKLLAPLLAAHPELEIQLDVAMRSANLAQREADIAVRLGGPGEQASLIGKRVAEMGRGLYASTAYLDIRGRSEKAEDLAAHDFVWHPPMGKDRWVKDEAGRHVPPKRIAFRTISGAAMLAATEAGMGIGDLFHWRARGRPGLERVLPKIELKPTEIWIVTHADIRRSARIRAVFDHLADGLAANAKLFLEGHPDGPEQIEAQLADHRN